jgi:hypothetical protein
MIYKKTGGEYFTEMEMIKLNLIWSVLYIRSKQEAPLTFLLVSMYHETIQYYRDCFLSDHLPNHESWKTFRHEMMAAVVHHDSWFSTRKCWVVFVSMHAYGSSGWFQRMIVLSA